MMISPPAAPPSVTPDIRWRDPLDQLLEESRQTGRPVVVKPLGQGCGDMDDW